MTTRYSDVSNPATIAFAMDAMLSHATPAMVLERFAKQHRMPKNKTETVQFRRPVVFSPATTPLREGVTPNLTQFRYEYVTGTVKQYGDLVEITDRIEDFAQDPVAQDAYTICGENIGRTMESLDWGVLRAGTNVYYANGSARSDVNTTISLSKQRAVTRGLRQNKAKKITQVLTGSNAFRTSPVEAAYVAVAHSDLESDIRNMPGFVETAKYGSRSVISEYEIGTVENVRYVLSEDLEPFTSAGAASTTMKSGNGGTNADVYPVLYIGQEAYGRVALRGANAVSPTMIPVNQRDKSDPLGQRGYIGWTGYHLCMILNQLWMARLEVAVTDL